MRNFMEFATTYKSNMNMSLEQKEQMKYSYKCCREKLNNNDHIICSVQDLFRNKGYNFEKKIYNEYFSFFKKYSITYSIGNYEKSGRLFAPYETEKIIQSFKIESLFRIKEDDIVILPYREETKSEIVRNFSFPAEGNFKIERVFAIVSESILSNAGRNFKKIISKQKMIKKTKKDCSILLPTSQSEYSFTFTFDNNPKNIYTIIIILNNGTCYACQPISNRTLKHYIKRVNDNLFTILKKENKIGMLFYHYSSILCGSGLQRNPDYDIDLYKINNDLIKLNKDNQTYSIEKYIELLKSMKEIKEKRNNILKSINFKV